MKQLFRIAMIFSLFLIGTAILSAQTLPPPPPPPPPAPDYFPDTWAQYESKEGRFRIRFPGKPKESVSTQETLAGKLDVHMMEYKGLLNYQVTYVDFPRSLEDPANAKEFLRATRTAVLEGTKKQNSLVVKEKEVSVNGHPGYFMHVEFDGRAVGRYQWVLVAKRLYTLVVVSRKGSANELEGKDDFEKVAMGFINSFEITPQ